MRLRHTIQSLEEPLEPQVSEALEAELSPLIPHDADLLKLNSEYLAENNESAAHVQASLRTRQLLDPKTADENQKDVIRTLALPSVSLEDAVRGSDLLKEWRAESRYLDDFIAAAHERWPEATTFITQKG